MRKYKKLWTEDRFKEGEYYQLYKGPEDTGEDGRCISLDRSKHTCVFEIYGRPVTLFLDFDEYQNSKARIEAACGLGEGSEFGEEFTLFADLLGGKHE